MRSLPTASVLARTEEARGYTASMTSAEGRTSSFKVEPLAIGDRRQVNTAPDGTAQTKLFKTNGEETTTAPDGTVTSATRYTYKSQAPAWAWELSA